MTSCTRLNQPPPFILYDVPSETKDQWHDRGSPRFMGRRQAKGRLGPHTRWEAGQKSFPSAARPHLKPQIPAFLSA